jgi:hypothetical protein
VTSVTDDSIAKVYELVEQPLRYYKTYSNSKTEEEMVAVPLVTAIRLLAAEVEALRDEVAVLRGKG